MKVDIERLVLTDMNLSATEAEGLCRHLSATLERVLRGENAGIIPQSQYTSDLTITVDHATPSQLATALAQRIATQINRGSNE